MAKIKEQAQEVYLSDDQGSNSVASITGLMPETGTDCNVHLHVRTENAEISVTVTNDVALELADALIKQANASTKFQRIYSTEVIDLLKAHSLCIKGAVGSLDVIYKGESIRGAPGFAYYDLEYYSDFGDEDNRDLLLKIEDYEFFFAADEASWFRQLSALVGGNHQYTQSIKISTKNFNHSIVINRLQVAMKKLRDEFIDALTDEDFAELNGTAKQ